MPILVLGWPPIKYNWPGTRYVLNSKLDVRLTHLLPLVTIHIESTC